ncbi:SCO family protein [Mycoavidus sp. B2-EB]|uniref:SCO family protein n=1 Tax=Mycoavidus sp. B2-EB TaxID=2651972 RepID=UPI001623A01F|nr:SCO family protein [Mycoavidus sp. B2-EB]BBO60361.1 lipoprotein [Mycoavidus sp. B2-EB]
MYKFTAAASKFTACLLCLLIGVAGCTRTPAFKNTDLTGNPSFGTDFTLPDTAGQMRTLADFKGKVVVLLFGYTHCPDICPMTLATLAQALKQLGNKAKRVQVLFVTVDPARDTLSSLARYVPAFDPSFIGLRPANEAQLKKVTQDFRVFFARESASVDEMAKTPTADAYTMDHTAAGYVFDASGTLRLFARDGQGPEPWVHDLKILLN